MCVSCRGGKARHAGVTGGSVRKAMGYFPGLRRHWPSCPPIFSGFRLELGQGGIRRWALLDLGALHGLLLYSEDQKGQSGANHVVVA